MERVCAVVVTYNRKESLRECLRALLRQTRTVDCILAVNNASTDNTPELLKAEFPQVEVLDLPENVGGAGGFHAGIKWAYEQGYEWIWIMDDDAIAAADCLARLLEQRRPGSVLVPLQKHSLGEMYGICVWRGRAIEATNDVVTGQLPLAGDYLFAFVGPLISREVVERVGLPIKEFFIWFDDWEYALRVHRAQAKSVVVVPDAIFYHDIGGKQRQVRFLWHTRLRAAIPAWKWYYGARNQLYALIKDKRPPAELLYYFYAHLRYFTADILYEPERWTLTKMRFRGMWDGVTGKLGKRV